MTKIEWCRNADGSEGVSWNALRAIRSIERKGETITVSANHCEPVCRACNLCYASRQNPRNGGLKFLRRHRGAYEFKIDERRLLYPLRRREPARIFVESMSDLFGEWWPVEFIDKPYAVMAATPYHTYINLTKRPQRRRDYLALWPMDGKPDRITEIARDLCYQVRGQKGNCGVVARPLPNVIEGTSVGDQHDADKFIPILMDTKAAWRGVSVEPMLGPVSLWKWLPHPYQEPKEGRGEPCMLCGIYTNGMHHPYARGLDWVICGGESGVGARPMHPDWARALRDECTAAGVPFFFKQWGTWVSEDQSPEDIVLPGSSRLFWGSKGPPVYNVGKKAAGRLLDGCIFDGFPDMRRTAYEAA